MSHLRHWLPLHEHEKYLKTVNQDPAHLVNIQPHSIEGGDPYYIGDVYQARTTPQGWELDCSERPYLSHVKALSTPLPHLRYLADWMEVTCAPPKWKFIKQNPQNQEHRAQRASVCMLDFRDGKLVEERRFAHARDVADRLGLPDHDDVESRLFIVEDLSRDVIEALGARFDIDPLFFRSQISDYLWYNIKDPWVELPDLDLVQQERSHFCMRYMRARYFRSPESFAEATTETGRFNVLRRLDSDKNHKTVLDEQGENVALARAKASVWIRPNKAHESGVLGIILVDPTVKEGFSLWGGYRSFFNSTGMPDPRAQQSGPEVPPAPSRKSLFEDVVFWSKHMTERDLEAIASDPRTIAVQMYKLVIADWLTLIKYITARLGQIEWELENPDFRKDSAGVDASLQKLHPWRRSVPLYRSFIADTIDRIFPQELAQYANRIERIVAVATAIISIEESRRAIAQNKNLARLTYLASIFVPMSFVSSFFSMSEDVTALSSTYWIYFCTALPLTIVALCVADFLHVQKLLSYIVGRTGDGLKAIREPTPPTKKTEK
ncbi:hypothetical protein BKA67DRAFT_599736 [Truncatella angustata]|uniref:Uncharacterized protein n=1 Tax=Truncatella angustata TaxID=152316 RepID=A0A9P8UQM2_9PEZI|nr:uncharacterized protein BKA67DRAFT_599736 [Truncatella angustata]KAH6656317.1 hypothetical protein BKA67DRAFT_599736 [Truncatella angustata]